MRVETSNHSEVMIKDLSPEQLSWAANNAWYKRRLDQGEVVKHWVLDDHRQGVVPQNLLENDPICHEIQEKRKMSVRPEGLIWKASIKTRSGLKVKAMGATINQAILRAYVMESEGLSSMNAGIKVPFIEGFSTETAS